MATQSLTYNRVTWTDVRKPTEDDVRLLRANHPQFHPLDLEDLLSRIERPKIDDYENYLFAVMYFPLWDPVEKISRASEVDVFVGTDFMITVHEGVLKPLNDLFLQCQERSEVRQELMGRGVSTLFYTVIDRLVDYVFPILYKVDANIEAVEENLFTADTRSVIEDITLIRRDIISLRRIVRPLVGIVANLERIDRPLIREELDVYFGDILDHLQKANDLLTDHMEVISTLANAAEILTNTRTNDIIRILTIVSVVVLPLILVSGLYGMNVTLPLAEHPHSFLILLAASLTITAVMLIYFRQRRWM